MSSSLHALGNYSIDLDITKLEKFFEHPVRAYINFLGLRNQIITILKKEGITYTNEKIPVDSISYEFNDQNQLLLTAYLHFDSKLSTSIIIGNIKNGCNNQISQVFDGQSSQELAILPKGTGCYIISDILEQFSHDVIDPYNIDGRNKDIKIAPNFPYKNKDNSTSNGILRICRPIQGVEEFFPILQNIIKQNDQKNDILLTGNEFSSEYIYEHISEIIQEKSSHRLFIVPTKYIIQNRHLLKNCYQNAFLLTMNSAELTELREPSRDSISKKHEDLINGYTGDYIRMITHESEGAALFLQEKGIKYKTNMNILEEDIGKKLIAMIYKLGDKERLEKYISRDIAQGVGAGDTAAAGLITAHYNIEQGKIELHGDSFENLQNKARYYLLFSQTLSFLTYHSVFSNFTQLREIIGDDQFNQVIEQINELVKIQMDPGKYN